MTSVFVNGEATILPSGSTVEDVVDIYAQPAGCAVARNGEIVLRSDWGSTGLEDDDRIEVLSIAPGG